MVSVPAIPFLGVPSPSNQGTERHPSVLEVGGALDSLSFVRFSCLIYPVISISYPFDYSALPMTLPMHFFNQSRLSGLILARA